METKGIEGVYLTTHNWAKSVRFFKAMGYSLDFETDHHSGQFTNGDSPYLFVAEVPGTEPTSVSLVIKVDGVAVDAADLEVVTPFEPTHWGTHEMTIRDPDGRIWSVQAPAAPA